MLNAAISYFDSENETEVLLNVYNKLYKLSLEYNDLAIIFVNLTEDLYTLSIDNLNKKIPYNSYSEYREYSLLELEDQISLLYNEFYLKHITFEPVVIIIHDCTKMSDCADEYEIYEYLNDKLGLLNVLRTYVFCTVRNQ